MHKASFITDFGKPLQLRDINTGEIEMVIPRYGVWAFDENKGANQVVEVSDNLDALFEKYGNVPVHEFDRT